ncbi:hypothetical protein RYX36_034824 [Vicia faba]
MQNFPKINLPQDKEVASSMPKKLENASVEMNPRPSLQEDSPFHRDRLLHTHSSPTSNLWSLSFDTLSSISSFRASDSTFQAQRHKPTKRKIPSRPSIGS